MSESEPPRTRRAAREAGATRADAAHAAHARLSPVQRWTRIGAAAIAIVLVAGAAVAVTAALGGPAVRSGTELDSAGLPRAAPAATAIPVPAQRTTKAVSCDDSAVSSALESGTDAEVIAAFGGGAAFRSAVASGAAPCIDLSVGERTWVVVNKRRPLSPLDYAPSPQVAAPGVRQVSGGLLREDAANALSELAAASEAEGAGQIAINSTYRSFGSQTRIHNEYVRTLGQQAAELRSARPGYSEHQTGLTADIVACDGGCGGLHTFGGTPQSDWVAANAWRFGFIVRYEDGRTDTTGYTWEPWHVRFIGVDLATAYHDGEFRTLEDFFGLPAAPDYEG